MVWHSVVSLPVTIYKETWKLNRRQAWWFLLLSEYNIKVIHTPGKKMIESDALSWRPDHLSGDDTDNTDVVMLPANLFIRLIDLNLQERIAESESLDKDAKGALTLLSEQGPDTLRNGTEAWMVELFNGKNILFYKGKNYIPLNPKLWHDIVESFHDHKTAGHPGKLEMYNAVQQHYWWPGLWTFTKNYVQGCGICQQFKINRSLSKPVFMPTEGSKSTRPFSNCSMDLITNLPLAEGFDSILVVVDQGLMKGVILIACNKTITAEGTARLLLENLYKQFGLPDKIISDRGPQFASRAF